MTTSLTCWSARWAQREQQNGDQPAATVATAHPAAGVRRRKFVVSAALAGACLWAGSPVWAQISGWPDFTGLVEQASPSVVNIRTLEKAPANPGPRGMDPDMLDFFRRFGLPLPSVPGNPHPGPRGGAPDESQPRGVGSGFILTADGMIMTNAHVVDGADEVIVTLTDKREFKARIVGADKRSDVAVVKIESAGLPAVRIGDVNRLKVGEWVLAIGSPFGLENTVTAGIVSAKQRDTGDYLPFIQTDVAINPGNSGGPLINMRGEVVGINSQIYSRSGGSMGISFSIPIDEAVRVSDQLRAHGRVARGRIGVQIDQVSKEVAESLGLPKAQGALVRAVEPGGPADKAGVEAGDIIVKVDARAVDKSSDLPRTIGAIKPGTQTKLTVFRRGAYQDLRVTVAEFDAENPPRRLGQGPSKPPANAGVGQSLGLTLSEIDAATRKALGGRGAVRIEAASGAAARAGLSEGDLILQVGHQPVADLKSFAAVLAHVDLKRPLGLMVRRGDLVQIVVVRPAAP